MKKIALMVFAMTLILAVSASAQTPPDQILRFDKQPVLQWSEGNLLMICHPNGCNTANFSPIYVGYQGKGFPAGTQTKIVQTFVPGFGNTFEIQFQLPGTNQWQPVTAGMVVQPPAANTPPANTPPANTAPANTAPANTAPANTAPANTAPANTAPANTAGPPAGTRVQNANIPPWYDDESGRFPPGTLFRVRNGQFQYKMPFPKPGWRNGWQNYTPSTTRASAAPAAGNPAPGSTVQGQGLIIYERDVPDPTRPGQIAGKIYIVYNPVTGETTIIIPKISGLWRTARMAIGATAVVATVYYGGYYIFVYCFMI